MTPAGRAPRVCRRAPPLALAALLAACATSALHDAKLAYDKGDFAAARAAAERAAARGDPQAHLVAARAATRQLAPAPPVDTLALAAIAAHLRAASRGWPFGEKWADREMASGVGDWLNFADLPELAEAYYAAALEAPGEAVDPGEAASAESRVQAGLERLDRWDPGSDKARATELRALARPVDKLLAKCGWPYPPGLADQALRLAWALGDPRAAWVYGASGWLRATASGDRAAAAALQGRIEDLVALSWREDGDDPSAVDATLAAWDVARRAWLAAGSAEGSTPNR